MPFKLFINCFFSLSSSQFHQLSKGKNAQLFKQVEIHLNLKIDNIKENIWERVVFVSCWIVQILKFQEIFQIHRHLIMNWFRQMLRMEKSSFMLSLTNFLNTVNTMSLKDFQVMIKRNLFPISKFSSCYASKVKSFCAVFQELFCFSFLTRRASVLDYKSSTTISMPTLNATCWVSHHEKKR